ncbi:MAG: formimidoylglutamase [Anaerolineae bacterium]|nr:formimidoylglutamase [Anaerolineae bacterium]
MIFELANRPDTTLFYQRGDPNDPRLVEIVQFDEKFYSDSQVVLLGCPQDEGVRRNKGRVGAASAPDTIRSYFYRLAAPEIFPRIFDLGNTRIASTLEATHQQHRDIVRQVIRDGKTLVVLGGGNDVSYPDCAGVALEIADILAFNVDAHFDVRADSPCNSGTPYRQLIEEGLIVPQKFYEMGWQPFGNSSTYLHYLNDHKVHHYSIHKIREIGVPTVFQTILSNMTVDAIFWGLDMDVVQAADAPGVSAPNPTGLTSAEFCKIAEIAGQDSRSRLFEITEVNPTYDIDGRTCRLAAAAIFYFLLGKA